MGLAKQGVRLSFDVRHLPTQSEFENWTDEEFQSWVVHSDAQTQNAFKRFETKPDASEFLFQLNETFQASFDFSSATNARAFGSPAAYSRGSGGLVENTAPFLDIEMEDLKDLHLPASIFYHLDAGSMGEADHPDRDGWGDFLMPAWAHASGYGHLRIENFSLNSSMTDRERLASIRHEIYMKRMNLDYNYSECRRYLPELEKVIELISQKMGVAYEALPPSEVPQYNLVISVSQLASVQHGGTVWGVDTKDKGIFQVHMSAQAVADLLAANGLKPDQISDDSQETVDFKISRNVFGSVARVPTISRADEPPPKPMLELASNEGEISLIDYQSHLSESTQLPAWIMHMEQAQELLFVIGMLVAPIASRGRASNALIGEMNARYERNYFDLPKSMINPLYPEAFREPVPPRSIPATPISRPPSSPPVPGNRPPSGSESPPQETGRFVMQESHANMGEGELQKNAQAQPRPIPATSHNLPPPLPSVANDQNVTRPLFEYGAGSSRNMNPVFPSSPGISRFDADIAFYGAVYEANILPGVDDSQEMDLPPAIRELVMEAPGVFTDAYDLPGHAEQELDDRGLIGDQPVVTVEKIIDEIRTDPELNSEFNRLWMEYTKYKNEKNFTKASRAYGELVELWEVAKGKVLEKEGMMAGDLPASDLGGADLPQHIQAAKNAGLSAQQIISLLRQINSSAGQYANRALEASPSVFEAATKAGLTPDQIVLLFGKIAQMTRWNTGEVFEYLPAALDSARRAGLSAEQIIYLFGKIAETGPGAHTQFKVIPTAIEAAALYNLDSVQIVALFEQIMEKTGENVSQAFKVLPAVLKTDAQPAKIVSLFEQILKNTPWNAHYDVLMALPAALEAGLTFDQIISLFEEIKNKTDRNTVYYVQKLPDLFKAGLRPEQIISLFGQIAENSGPQEGHRFSLFGLTNHNHDTNTSLLESAKKAGLTPDWMAHFFGQVIEKTENDNDAGWAFMAFDSILGATSPETVEKNSESFLRLLNSLTDQTRQRVLVLLSNNSLLFQRLGPTDFSAHLEFYVTILERWLQLGDSILEEILKATIAGIIPNDISSARNQILDFIEQTNGFVASQYAEQYGYEFKDPTSISEEEQRAQILAGRERLKSQMRGTYEEEIARGGIPARYEVEDGTFLYDSAKAALYLEESIFNDWLGAYEADLDAGRCHFPDWGNYEEVSNILDDPYADRLDKRHAALILRLMYENWNQTGRLSSEEQNAFIARFRFYGEMPAMPDGRPSIPYPRLVIDRPEAGNDALKAFDFNLDTVPRSDGGRSYPSVPTNQLTALRKGDIDQIRIFRDENLVATIGFDYETDHLFVWNNTERITPVESSFARGTSMVKLAHIFPRTCEANPFSVTADTSFTDLGFRLELTNNITTPLGYNIPYTEDPRMIRFLDQHLGEHDTHSDQRVSLSNGQRYRVEKRHLVSPPPHDMIARETWILTVIGFDFEVGLDVADLLYNTDGKIIGIVYPQVDGASDGSQKVGAVYFMDDLVALGSNNPITQVFFERVRQTEDYRN